MRIENGMNFSKMIPLYYEFILKIKTIFNTKLIYFIGNFQEGEFQHGVIIVPLRCAVLENMLDY